jgi:hypothetical protein
MYLKIVFLLSFSYLFSAKLAALPPIPIKANYPLINPLDYKDEQALRKAWKPMRDTSPVAIVDIPSGKALKMPCDYKSTKINRASWDLSVNLDLTTCNGIQFKILCDDPTPISGFTFYMKSGRGWYSHEFFVNKRGKWNTVIIDKSKTGVEGAPDGWGSIKTIRISAWRGKRVNTEFHIADLGLYGADASIAIIRGGDLRQLRIYDSCVINRRLHQ